MAVLTLDDIRNDQRIETYIRKGDDLLAAMGYTEHSFRHAALVSRITEQVLSRLGFSERDVEIGAIAGYMHDIGNVVSRHDHPEMGAVLAERVLTSLEMPVEEIASIIGAIGNHEEGSGDVVSSLGAALILADKSDVHRSRVRNRDFATFDIHDRVNYAVEKSFLRVDAAAKTVKLELEIDTEISPVIDYFEIFLTRMVMCRRAAAFLGCRFELVVNSGRLL
ncbi:MAG: HD domain-containing protein [Chloroflexota bacterium]